MVRNNNIAKCWLTCAERAIHAEVWRAASESNVADGPSRNDLSLVKRLQSGERPLDLPEWLKSIHSFEALSMCKMAKQFGYPTSYC